MWVYNEEYLEWSMEYKDSRRHSINQVGGCENGIPQKMFWDIGRKDERLSNFKEVSIFLFGNTILLKHKSFDG